MNKKVLTLIAGSGVIGFIGGLAIWYTGRKSYHKGFNDGCKTILFIKEIDDAFKNKEES